VFWIALKRLQDTTEAVDVSEDQEVVMRQRRPTAANHDELLQMMELTRGTRRDWINQTKPSITDIIKRYPRLLDMNDAVISFFIIFLFFSVLCCELVIAFSIIIAGRSL
jgi:hypothetical protein